MSRHVGCIWSVTVLASAWLAPAGLICPALAQEAPTLAVVFDGSGSMWGKLEGERAPKLSLARDAVLAGLEKVDAKVRTGLVTFGRRRGDCGDIEVVAKPDSSDAERFKEPLEKLNPKGRGPIVQAVREAAKAIGAARPASLVLIHDDLDNCQQDACQLAVDLKRDHPGLRVNVVSLGMRKEELPRIACLAELTGGRHFDAQSGPQVAAFIGQAMSAAGPAVAPTTAAPATRPPAPAAVARPAREMSGPARVPAPPRRPTPVPSEGPPGLWLSAVLSADGPLVGDAVVWRVLRKTADGESSAFEAYASEPRAQLQPGTYVVEVRWGLVRKRLTLEVAPDKPTAGVVPLDAGGLRLSARAQPGGPPIDQVTYAVYPATGDGQPAADPVWIGSDPVDPLGVPPGAYRIVAERGYARNEAKATVAAGAVADADIALGAGLLTLKVAAREDGEALPGALFVIAVDEPSQPHGVRELVRSTAPQPDFVLPAGSYTVTTRIGDSEARDKIVLGAGESVRRTIVLGLGRLALSARVEQAAGQAPLREPIGFRVMRRDGEGREVARGGTTPYAFELPAGSYRVEAQVGTHNARVARDVELQLGRTTQLAFDIPAARLTLKLAEDMGKGDTTWEVRDDAGRVVARSTLVEPQLVLAPGRYTIRAAVRDRRGEEEVSLRIGESRIIEVERD